MDLDAVRALRRQRHRDRHQLLVLERDRPVFKGCLVEGDEPLEGFESKLAQLGNALWTFVMDVDSSESAEDTTDA